MIPLTVCRINSSRKSLQREKAGGAYRQRVFLGLCYGDKLFCGLPCTDFWHGNLPSSSQPPSLLCLTAGFMSTTKPSVKCHNLRETFEMVMSVIITSPKHLLCDQFYREISPAILTVAWGRQDYHLTFAKIRNWVLLKKSNFPYISQVSMDLPMTWTQIYLVSVPEQTINTLLPWLLFL